MSFSPMDRAIDSAINRFGEHAYFHLEGVKAALPRQPESPIEEAFLVAVICCNMMVPVLDLPGMPHAGYFKNTRLTVSLQEQIGQYRVDFLFVCYKNEVEVAKFVVECDGHDFHERTKDQAARDKSRDRALTTQGYRVLRFTGSEIYRDAYGCVAEVLNAYLSLTRDQRGAE